MNVYFDCGRIIKIRTVQGLRAAGFSLLLLLHSLLLLQHTLFCKQQVIRCCFVYRCVESPYVLQFSSEITPVTTEAVGLDKLGELVLSEWSCWAHMFSSVCAQLTKSFQSLGPSEGWWGRGRREKLCSSQHRALGAGPEWELMVVLPVKGWIRPWAASLAAPSGAAVLHKNFLPWH